MKEATRLLLILMANMLDSATVARLNRMMIDLLFEMAEKTETDIDDRIVELISRFVGKPTDTH